MSHHASSTTDLLNLERNELQGLLDAWGQPRYRADQIWNWLYSNLATSADEMSNLPENLRARLAGETCIGRLRPIAQQKSRDGLTTKWLFELPARAARRSDRQKAGSQVETVLMGYEHRRTACISSQAGCSMGCSFCATGQMGFQRNLTAGEIVAQVLVVARELTRHGEKLTNVVLMGMGEPLANYDASIAALRRLIDPHGFDMGQRRITLSTVGLVPAIERFSRERLQVGLAVSLHAATDELRNSIVPINRRYPLNQLMDACRDYLARTHRRISFEWTLIAGVNDSADQARALARWVRGMLCHVNLIPLNPSPGYPGAPTPPEQIAVFRSELDLHGIPHSLRLRRGIDIQAGCGQLRQRAATSVVDRDRS